MKRLRWSGIVLALVAVGLALGVRAPGAQAHAFLQKSVPADGAIINQAPIEVLMWFSEDLEMTYSHAQVIDATGKRWDNNDFHIHTDAKQPGITMQQNLPDGTYVVIWDALSAVDGHRTKGSFTFFMGTPSAPPSAAVLAASGGGGSSGGPPNWLQITIRWLNFAAMAVLIGAAAFPFLILTAGLKRLSSDVDAARRRAVHVSRRSALVAAVVLVLGAVALLWVQAWSAGGSATSFSEIDNVVSGTRFGDIWTIRIVLVGAALACALFMARQRLEGFKMSIFAGENSAWLLMLALALALPLTTSLNSHAAAGSSSGLQTAVDWGHLVAGGIWVGGLVQFLLVVPAVVRSIRDPAGLISGMVRRFSAVAIVSVAVLVTTGVIQSIDRLGGVDELVTSNYGYTLAAKVALLLPLLAIGAYNLLVTGPRFLALAREHTAGLLERIYELRFRRALAAEITLAAAILVATAILTNSSPPGPAQGSAAQTAGFVTPAPSAGQPVKATSGDLDITVWADPAQPGINDLNVHVIDTNGDEKPIQRVIARITYKDGSLGTSEIDPTSPGGPHYVATTSAMSLPGKYDVEVVVRRESLLDERVIVTLQIGA